MVCVIYLGNVERSSSVEGLYFPPELDRGVEQGGIEDNKLLRSVSGP